MLKIRADQLHTLSLDEAYTSFVVEMIDHLRKYFAEELRELDDLSLADEIQTCLMRARAYGLTSRSDCGRFLGLAASLGWSFDTERPWVQALLRNPATSPSDRLAEVHARCVEQLQQEADGIARRRKFGI